MKKVKVDLISKTVVPPPLPPILKVITPRNNDFFFNAIN